jgi:hypothetical protein
MYWLNATSEGRRAIDPQIIEPGVQLVEFITQYEIKSLNVAGPRASGEPQIGEFVKRVMDAAFPQ